MKSRILTCITAMTLFAVLAIHVPLAAQKQIRYTVTDLGTLGGTFSQAFGIYNNGSVVGCATLNGDTALHAFLWRKGVMTDLGTLGGSDTLPYSQALNVNDRDEVEGVIWQNGEASGLGFLPGDIVSIGSAISDSGLVTGQSCDSNGNCRGFLWRNGVMTDLGTLVPADSPLDFPDPTGINSRDQIVGLGVQKSTGELHGFLLTPTDTEVASENATPAAQGEFSQSRRVILPDIVRRALQRRLGSRHRIPGLVAPRN